MDALQDTAQLPPAARPQRPKRRRWVYGGIGAVLVAAVCLAWFLVTRGRVTTDDAQIEADVVPLSARISGQIVRVLVRENDPVHEGQVLMEIDDAEYAARVHNATAAHDAAVAQADAADAQVAIAEAAARGGYSSAEAGVSESSAAVLGSQAQVSAARASVVRARADLHKASLDYDRAKTLVQTHAIPQQQYDSARAVYLAAKAALTEAKAQLRNSEDAHRTASERVREAQGRLGASRPVEQQIAAARANSRLAHAKADSAAAELTLAQLQLEYTKVTAPFDGVLSSLAVHPGFYVEPGQALAQIVPDETHVVANFKETQVTHMKVGQRAIVKVDAYPSFKLRAHVESFSGGTGARFALLPPDNATGNFVKVVQRVPVRLAWDSLPPELPRLRPGLSVEVKVYEREGKQGSSEHPAAGPALGFRP